MAEGRAQLPTPLGLRFKPDMLADYGLPDILYPLSAAMLSEVLGEVPCEGGELDFALLLHALQQRSAGGVPPGRRTSQPWPVSPS